MINANMKPYDYYLYSDNNAYAQPQLSETAQGTITMAITATSQSIQDNINYKGATYLGLTFADVTDKYVFQYGDKKLKVLYVNPQSRLKQIFLGDM